MFPERETIGSRVGAPTEIVEVFGDGFGLLSCGLALGQEDLGLVEDLSTELFQHLLVGHGLCGHVCESGGSCVVGRIERINGQRVG